MAKKNLGKALKDFAETAAAFLTGVGLAVPEITKSFFNVLCHLSSPPGCA